MKIQLLMPFTYPWIIRHHLNNFRTVLDVGCGNGSFMNKVNIEREFKITGVELFVPYIKNARKSGVYTIVLRQDIRKMKFKLGSFNAVHSSQVLEHLKKSDGLDLIKKMENIASNVVIIGTPNGHFHQEEYDGNKLQEHHSAWDIESFEKLGYKVYGQGLKAIYGEQGLLEKGKSISILKILLFGLSVFCSPFVYFNPKFAAHIIAVKHV